MSRKSGVFTVHSKVFVEHERRGETPTCRPESLRRATAPVAPGRADLTQLGLHLGPGSRPRRLHDLVEHGQHPLALLIAQLTFTILCHTTIAIWRAWWAAWRPAGRSSRARSAPAPTTCGRRCEFRRRPPTETLGRVVAFFTSRRRGPANRARRRELRSRRSRSAVGDLGSITTTPKPGWRHVDRRATAARARNPCRLRHRRERRGAGRAPLGRRAGRSSPVYVTVGSGIGGGIVLNGRTGPRARPSRDGSPAAPHDRQRDPFPGVCPHHGDCWEGLASAPALAARWGQPPEALPDVHPAWDLEADYLALGLANVVLVLSPERIVLGGGVMTRASLWPMVRAKLVAVLGGYVSSRRSGKGSRATWCRQLSATGWSPRRAGSRTDGSAVAGSGSPERKRPSWPAAGGARHCHARCRGGGRGGRPIGDTASELARWARLAGPTDGPSATVLEALWCAAVQESVSRSPWPSTSPSKEGTAFPIWRWTAVRSPTMQTSSGIVWSRKAPACLADDSSNERDQ